MSRSPRPPRHVPLRWQMVGGFLPIVLAAVGALAITGHVQVERVLRERALARLTALSERTAALVENRFGRIADQTALAAGDPRVIEATVALAGATRELDQDPSGRDAAESQVARVRALLRDYYAAQPERRAVALDALLPPQRSALLLQSLYLGGADPSALRGAEQPRPRYVDEHAVWSPVLQKLAERAGWRDLLLVEARGGRVVYSSAKTPVFQTSLVDGPFATSNAGELFRRAQGAAPGDVLISDLEAFLPRRGAPVAFAASPIFDKEGLAGALLVEISPPEVGAAPAADERASEDGLDAAAEVLVVGADRRARTESRSFERLAKRDPALATAGTAVLTYRVDVPEDLAGEKGRGAAGRYPEDRGFRLVAATPISVPDLHWTAVARMSEREALEPLARIDRGLGLAVGLVLLAAALASLALASFVARPARQLLDTLVAVGHGNLRARARLDTRNELGAIGRGVNGLIDQVSQRQGQDSAERRRLESDAQDLIAVIGAAARGDATRRARVDGPLAGLAGAINGMCASLADLSERLCHIPARLVEMSTTAQTATEQALREAVRQVDEVERGAGGAQRLSAVLGRAAAAADTATGDAERGRSAFEEGREAVRRMGAGIDLLHKGVRASGGRLKRLGERSMQQASVAGSLAKISADIGMLSLNAAIEASRAGQPGPASGIVAEELRKLAERADAMREEVARSVEALQGDVNEALSGTDRQAEQTQQLAVRLADVEACLLGLFEPIGRSAATLAELAPALLSAEREAVALQGSSVEARDAARRLCTLAETAHANVQTLLATAADLPAKRAAADGRNGDEHGDEQGSRGAGRGAGNGTAIATDGRNGGTRM